MSQQEKGDLFRKLKAAGVEFSKQYRNYTTDEFRAAADRIIEKDPALAVKVGLIHAPPAAAPPQVEPELSDAEAAAFFGQSPASTDPTSGRMPASGPQPGSIPVAVKNPDELPGQRLNQHVELEPIRTDEQGRIWYQEEVAKPAFAKPRGRRVLQYMESGVETKTVQNGEFVETFEVAGTANRRPAEVKITLPSYQVGIYKDPRFPFKIHTYNGNQGFDLFEVQDYWGGSELVPETVKRVYVENVLCYDIRTVVRAIQTEFRQLQLQGKVK